MGCETYIGSDDERTHLRGGMRIGGGSVWWSSLKWGSEGEDLGFALETFYLCHT